LIVAGTGAEIAFAANSIIISTGSLHISHSVNNIIVCGGDVDIAHDGSLGSGSLIISKGRITISHATNTLVYAVEGADISHMHKVRPFNTHDLKTTFGVVDNISIKPLFRWEPVSARPRPAAAGDGD
jgi:hypothetical protein